MASSDSQLATRRYGSFRLSTFVQDLHCVRSPGIHMRLMRASEGAISFCQFCGVKSQDTIHSHCRKGAGSLSVVIVPERQRLPHAAPFVFAEKVIPIAKFL